MVIIHNLLIDCICQNVTNNECILQLHCETHDTYCAKDNKDYMFIQTVVESFSNQSNEHTFAPQVEATLSSPYQRAVLLSPANSYLRCG